MGKNKRLLKQKPTQTTAVVTPAETPSEETVMPKVKYTGRTFEALKKAQLSTYTGEEMEFFNKELAKKTEKTEPGLFGKAALLAKAAINNVSEKVESFSTDITLAMVRQSIRDKEKSALNKEMALANLDILRKHNEISQDEYEAALEELEAE
jgi:DNA-directed RNA polymerase